MLGLLAATSVLVTPVDAVVVVVGAPMRDSAAEAAALSVATQAFDGASFAVSKTVERCEKPRPCVLETLARRGSAAVIQLTLASVGSAVFVDADVLDTQGKSHGLVTVKVSIDAGAVPPQLSGLATAAFQSLSAQLQPVERPMAEVPQPTPRPQPHDTTVVAALGVGGAVLFAAAASCLVGGLVAQNQLTAALSNGRYNLTMRDAFALRDTSNTLFTVGLITGVVSLLLGGTALGVGLAQ